MCHPYIKTPLLLITYKRLQSRFYLQQELTNRSSPVCIQSDVCSCRLYSDRSPTFSWSLSFCHWTLSGIKFRLFFVISLDHVKFHWDNPKLAAYIEMVTSWQLLIEGKCRSVCCSSKILKLPQYSLSIYTRMNFYFLWWYVLILKWSQFMTPISLRLVVAFINKDTLISYIYERVKVAQIFINLWVLYFLIKLLLIQNLVIKPDQPETDLNFRTINIYFTA